MQNSSFRGIRERWTYRGYLMSETDDNRWAVEVGGTARIVGDYPTREAATRAVDYRENNARPEGVADTLERVRRLL